MEISINNKYKIFDRDNFTPIRGEPILETLHNFRDDIKANAKAVYSNLRGGTHGHLGLVLTDEKYGLISPTPLVYLTHPGLLIIPDSPHELQHADIAHQGSATFSRSDGSRASSCTTNSFHGHRIVIHRYPQPDNKSTKNNVADVLTYLQGNYGQLIKHKLLEHKETVKKMTYNP